MGTSKLSQKLNIDIKSSERLIESFKKKFPEINKFISNVIKFCEENGYVKTIFNRRRYLRNIYSKNTNEKNKAIRQCVNTTCQGSVADLIKKSMLNIEKRIIQFEKKKNCNNSANLLLQIHDELIFEVNEKYLNEISSIIKFEMENCEKFLVITPVKISYGKNWGELVLM
jgi:DNA polymerase I